MNLANYIISKCFRSIFFQVKAEYNPKLFTTNVFIRTMEIDLDMTSCGVLLYVPYHTPAWSCSNIEVFAVTFCCFRDQATSVGVSFPSAHVYVSHGRLQLLDTTNFLFVRIDDDDWWWSKTKSLLLSILQPSVSLQVYLVQSSIFYLCNHEILSKDSIFDCPSTGSTLVFCRIMDNDYDSELSSSTTPIF